MKPRPILFAFVGGLAAAAAGFLACSSGGSASQDAGVDGGPDTGTGITVFDTSAPDTTIGTTETGTFGDGGSGGDSGHHDSGVKTDAVTVDAPGGHCSAVTGQCDIVSQNCANQMECDLVDEADGGLGTECMATTASEHLAKGAPCCPTSDGTNPCDPGLECNGGNPCADGGTPSNAGWGGSNCTPRCCPALDGGDNTANCGTAGDGGSQGQCDLDITFNIGDAAVTEYSVCTYPPPCEPLGVHPCMSGFACEVENAAGTSSCVVIFNQGGAASGATQGQPCMYENQCADGLGCFGTTATNSACQWLCRIPSEPTPFDAGVLNATPGHGGCPTGQTCEGVTSGFPAWLGVCGS